MADTETYSKNIPNLIKLDIEVDGWNLKLVEEVVIKKYSGWLEKGYRFTEYDLNKFSALILLNYKIEDIPEHVLKYSFKDEERKKYKDDILIHIYKYKKFRGELTNEERNHFYELFAVKKKKIEEAYRKAILESGPKADDKAAKNAPKKAAENAERYKKLIEPIHSIYNYQKYYDYNTDKGYEILKPLRSQIVVLRGAVYNGLLTLAVLVVCLLMMLVKAILGRDWSKDQFHRLVMILLTGALVWGLCYAGARGVDKAEEEYDKNVVGIFYGHKAAIRDNHDLTK